MCSLHGSKTRPFHRLEDSGKRAWQRSVLRGARRKEVEDYLERCADINVDVEALERLMEPEEVEVCLRFILKFSTRRGSNIFQLFDNEKKDHFVASRRRWLDHQGERDCSLARKLAK